MLTLTEFLKSAVLLKKQFCDQQKNFVAESE